jgi:hypothetical protein
VPTTATSQSLAPGRVFVAIAAGRARAAATRDALRAYVDILRVLWSGETVECRGESIRLDGDARPVPVFTCASGPRGLRQAGEIANGVIIESGVSEDAIKQRHGSVPDEERRLAVDRAQIRQLLRPRGAGCRGPTRLGWRRCVTQSVPSACLATIASSACCPFAKNGWLTAARRFASPARPLLPLKPVLPSL